MAFGYYLNFEKVSTEIIEEQIEKMTDSNIYYFDDDYDNVVDEEKLENNLKYGSISIVFLQNLFETSLNTILRRRADITEFDILKSSITTKLQIISIIYKFDLSMIKSNNLYGEYRKIEKIRNDITHFKSNILCESTFILKDITLDLGTSKEKIAYVFTKKYIRECYVNTIKLIELVCSYCGLFVNKEVQIIDCDGRDSICEFIVNIDPNERLL